MIIAAGPGVAGLPLWAVCASVFAALLVVSLIAVLSPLASKERSARQARLDEVQRYRVLGVFDAVAPQTAAPAAARGTLTVRALEVVDRVVRRRGYRDRLVAEVERAGLRMRPEEWAAVQLACVLGAAVLLLFVAGIAGPVLGAVAAWLGCRYFLHVRTHRRRTAFEAQLPDVLEILGGALRSGFALNQAITVAMRECGEPVAGELSRAMQEVRLGADVEDALDAVAARVGSSDMRLVVSAVRTSREVGGNLAEVLQTVVTTMRERVQLRGQVRSLTAEGRLSAKILIGLPVLMAAYLLTFNRSYISPLYTTTPGWILIVIGVVLLSVGSVWLNRITKIEV